MMVDKLGINKQIDSENAKSPKMPIKYAIKLSPNVDALEKEIIILESIRKYSKCNISQIVDVGTIYFTNYPRDEKNMKSKPKSKHIC